ncbi:MAG: hypothetical protein HY718_16545 [Planctomycetes bacterium]|nr:hypothetical protein [Planctomycetota bacterium]
MPRMICLANSVKHNERCIAGIDEMTGQWIRPVYRLREKALPPWVRLIEGREPAILDVIDVPLEDIGPDEGCQPENRLVRKGAWKLVRHASVDQVLRYCEPNVVILHNHERCVRAEFFSRLPRERWKSLQLVRVGDAQFLRRERDDRVRWQVRFRDGSGRLLDLRLTDAVARDRLDRGETLRSDCLLTVSLTTPWAPEDQSLPP